MTSAMSPLHLSGGAPPVSYLRLKALRYGVDLMISTLDGSVGNQDLGDTRVLLQEQVVSSAPPCCSAHSVPTQSSALVQCSATVVQVALFTRLVREWRWVELTRPLPPPPDSGIFTGTSCSKPQDGAWGLHLPQPHWSSLTSH